MPQGLTDGDRVRFMAVLRDLAGRVITRQPDHERSQRAYRQLDASARAGQNQGRVEVKAVDNPLPAPRERTKEPGPARGPGGGGGGGGG